jgi:hypothetical protein
MNETLKTDEANTFWLIVPPESPCGCGSGKNFGECHLKNGNIELSPKNIDPSMPATGHSNRKCYFAFTNDCDRKISREHIISRVVLSKISDKQINVTKNGVTTTYSLDSSSLTTKRMCRRHNTAINPIDYQAGRFIEAVIRAQNVALNKANTNQRLFLFHGFDLERWLLKTLLNVYYSRQSVDPQKFVLPSNLMNYFFYPLKPPFGVYIPSLLDNEARYSMQISPMTQVNLYVEGNLVCGLTISLAGLELRFLVAGHPETVEKFSYQNVYRPEYINFFQDDEVLSIYTIFAQGSGNVVWLLPDPAGLPPQGILE